MKRVIVVLITIVVISSLNEVSANHPQFDFYLNENYEIEFSGRIREVPTSNWLGEFEISQKNFHFGENGFFVILTNSVIHYDWNFERNVIFQIQNSLTHYPLYKIRGIHQTKKFFVLVIERISFRRNEEIKTVQIYRLWWKKNDKK